MLLTWISLECHMKFIYKISREIHLIRACTWNSRDNFHVNFTWIEIHMILMWNLFHEFHLNFYTKKMIFFMISIDQKNLNVIWNTFYFKIPVHFTWNINHVLSREIHLSFTSDSCEIHNWFIFEFRVKFIGG